MKKKQTVYLIYLRFPEKKMKDHPVRELLKDYSTTQITKSGAFICLYAWTVNKSTKDVFLWQRKKKYFYCVEYTMDQVALELFARKYISFEIDERYLSENFQLDCQKTEIPVFMPCIEVDFIQEAFPDDFIHDCISDDPLIGSVFTMDIQKTLSDLKYPYMSMDDLIEGVYMGDESSKMVFDELMIFLNHFGFLLSDEVYLLLWSARKLDIEEEIE